MSRGLIVAIALTPALHGAIWPEQLWEHKRTALREVAISPSDKAVWDEYGLEAAEEAQYGAWKGIGYRLKDPTSAFAVYQWLKPVGAKTSPLEMYAVQTGDRAFLLKGNFVLDFVGRVPVQQEVDILHIQLARLDQSALPTLPMFMPAANQIRHGWIMLGIPQHQQGVQVSGLHKIVKIRFHVFSGND